MVQEKDIPQSDPQAATPAAPSPTFPHLNINVNAQGLILSTILAPGVMLTQQIDANTMDAVVKEYVKAKKEERDQLEIIRHVRQTRND